MTSAYDVCIYDVCIYDVSMYIYIYIYTQLYNVYDGSEKILPFS